VHFVIEAVEPVLDIMKSVFGFTRVRLLGIENIELEWTFITRAYTARRPCNMRDAKATT
jgi:hypothetical protein